MFADDTNLFLSGINLDDLFSDMNWELNKISLWFKANELLLNLTKAKYSLFHSASKKRFLREPLPLLKMDNIAIERENVTKFLGKKTILETANKRCQHKNIKKHWYPLQI